MRILISDETGMGKGYIGETSGSQLVDPGGEMGFHVGTIGTHGLGIRLEYFHKLKMPTTV